MRSFPSPTPPFLATTKGLAALWTLAMGGLVLVSWVVDLRDWERFQEWLWRAFRVYAVAERSRSNEIERFFLEIQFTLYFLFCIIKQ